MYYEYRISTNKQGEMLSYCSYIGIRSSNIVNGVVFWVYHFIDRAFIREYTVENFLKKENMNSPVYFILHNNRQPRCMEVLFF